MNTKSNALLFAEWSLPGETLGEKILAAAKRYEQKQGKPAGAAYMRTPPLEPLTIAGIEVKADKSLKAQDIVITEGAAIDTAEKQLTAKQLPLL